MLRKIIHILWKLVPGFAKRLVMDEFKLLVRSVIEVPNQCILAAVRFVCWNQIPGDYLEFGCHSGRTFCYAYRLFIFDDYSFFRGDARLGERGAFSEWLSRNPQIMATELAKHDFDSVAFFLSLRR